MKSLLFVMILKSTLALLLRPIAPFRTTTVKLFSSQPARKFRSFPFPYHSEMVVEIESLTSLGQGVARVPLPAADAESHDGENRWVVFVPSVLPGETVRVRVFRNDKTFSDADLVEVITPSPAASISTSASRNNAGLSSSKLLTSLLATIISIARATF